MVYTITFNPAIDYVMHIDALKTDDINRSKNEQICFGGKGINVSAVLTQLGTKTKALGFLAGFTGKQLEQMLNENGIENEFNYLNFGNTRINVKLKADTEIDINANGPEITANDIEGLLTKLDDIKSGDYLVLAGSIPSSLPNDIYERILARLEGRGIQFVVDATDNLLLNALKYKPFLVKPNHHELGAMFGVEINTDNDVELYAKRLQQMGAKNVLVSMADKGAILIDENGVKHKSFNARGRLINSVGCGDSMVAGFISGYIATGDYAHALKLGTACGNATAYSQNLATKEEIDSILSQL